MKEPTSPLSAASAAERLTVTARELAARAATLHLDDIKPDGFQMVMLEECADAVAFWLAELKKRVAK
jgi:hypothetical protein